MSLNQFVCKRSVITDGGIIADPPTFKISPRWKRALGAAIAIVCTTMLFTGLESKVNASESDKKTIVTFNAPVEIPGKALPAGTYVFKVLDTPGSRNFVQVFDKDEKQLYATIMGIPDYRLKPSDKPVITFEERASDAPEAIKAFFYPGDDYGVQFVYPRDKAVQLAKRTNQNVLSMGNDMAKNITAPAKSANSPSVQAMQNTEVKGVNPSGDEVELVVIIAPKPEK
jgi:hypothetical protein